jgi:hypothetical protein
LREHIADPRWHAVFQHPRRSGDVFDVEISSQPVVYDGRPAHFVVASGVTERQRVET